MENKYLKRAEMLIRALYGEPPAENTYPYEVYLEALTIQEEYLKAAAGVKDGGEITLPELSAGGDNEIKKLSLGDYTVEYFNNSGSASSSSTVKTTVTFSGLIAPAAAVLLESIYDIRHAEAII